MKDSQDWLDEIVLDYLRKFDYNNKYILPFDCHIDGRVGDMLGESLEEYNELMELYGELKSAIRKHILQEALEMIGKDALYNPRLKYPPKDGTSLGTKDFVIGYNGAKDELRNKFNDKYKED